MAAGGGEVKLRVVVVVVVRGKRSTFLRIKVILD